jgi:alpha-galactosidase
MKLVLIGAGSAQFGLGTMGDMFRSRLLRGAEICLMDINGESLERVRKIGQDFIDGKGLDFTLTATTDRAEALDRADHVIISIEVGDRFELWDQDWNYPMQYGFNQIYGENGGAGGLFHSLRIIPSDPRYLFGCNAPCPGGYGILLLQPHDLHHDGGPA